MTKKVTMLAFLVFGIVGLLCAKSDAQPGFKQTKDMIVAGNARFEVLSPTLVRMEYSGDGHFINQRTVVVVRRKWPAVKVTANESNGWLTISTGQITLKYLLSSGKFTDRNLDVMWTYGDQKGKWSPGDSDRMNLGGITYSLDGISGKHLPGFTDGLLSRNGYYMLDDSHSPVWNTKTKWIEPRPGRSSQDWYFFAYGKDYHHGLYECSELCGKIPMMPRYTLGTWMTDLNYEYLASSGLVTHYHYTSKNLKDEIERFRSEGLPLDVLVMDFAWHNLGWQGGYDWSPIFSNPVRFLKWAHEYGLHVTVNDHPGYGSESILSDKDSKAMEVRKLLGLPMPAKPSLLINFNKNWKFRLDPHDQGLQDDWYSTSFDDNGWQVLQAGKSWQDQGHPGVHGFAWYRKWVDLPSRLPKKVYAIFGGVDDEYDLFINGEKVTHHGSPGNSVYNTTTVTDVKNYVKPGKANLVVVRVKDWGGYGGLTKLPVEFSNVVPSNGIKFNLANKLQDRVFMQVLHAPVMRDGVDFWWIDGGSGACSMKGLNNQLWTNRVYYDFTRDFTHDRGLIFSRYGGWGNERYPAFFTGDTHSEWAVLKYEVPFTARAGNVLMPYVTHDIGGFLGDSIGANMYSRWLQFGALSPIMRLHCAFENPEDGNMRMPWVYGKTAVKVARIFLNLRERLIPYIYTYTRVAYDSALPVVRPLYLKYPDLPEAYHHPNEYLFGNEFLVAPITDSTGVAPVYFPPGEWIDYFNGQKYSSGQSISDTCSMTTMPLFVKEGSIVPMQSKMAYSDQRNIDTLALDVFGPRSGSFNLYQDDGTSLAYQHGAFSWTMLHFTREADGGYHLVVEPTKGRFRGQLSRRAYAISVRGIHLPATVSLNGRPLSTERSSHGSWIWDNNTSTLKIHVPLENIRRRLDINIQ